MSAGGQMGQQLQPSTTTLPMPTASNSEEDEEWCTDNGMLNVSAAKLKKLETLIVKQKKFDSKPLGKAVCWSCGKILHASADSCRTFLVPSNGKAAAQAPASAYLQALPYDNGLTFIHSSTKWYSCPTCKRGKAIPTDQHVGDVLLPPPSSAPKRTDLWNMKLPDALDLANDYERRQVSLCGLFSTTVREVTPTQSRHVLGQVFTGHKLDRHYYGLFGFLAAKEEDISAHSKKPASDACILQALKWLKQNNHLYSDFYANFETMYRYQPQSAVLNPSLLQQQNIKLDELLQQEAIGMIFPANSEYFNQFPAIHSTQQAAGVQHPRTDLHELLTHALEHLQQLTTAHYGDKFLEAKVFPHIHPFGFGGWYYGCSMDFSDHVKMRLFDVRGWYARDRQYPFYKFDLMTKQRLKAYACKTVNTTQQTAKITAEKVLTAEKSTDPYSSYGTEMPNCIPGSPQYWKTFGLNLIAMTQTRGLPDFFVTLTVNDAWPHIQATIKDGWGAATKVDEINLAESVSNRQPAGGHPDVCVMAAEERFTWYMRNFLCNAKEAPLGKVVDYVWKKEYQKRGAVHWHMLLWIEPGTIPNDAVAAEMPRPANTGSATARYLRKMVRKLEAHDFCTPKCFQKAFGQISSKCKYGFPYSVPQEIEALDEENTRYLYPRHHKEDSLVVPHNLEILVVWGAGHNVQRVSRHGFEMYLAKYISKAEPTTKIELPENASAPERYLKTRVIGAIEALEVLMSFQQHRMSRMAIYLPTEIKPTSKVLKGKKQLETLPPNSEDIFFRSKFETYLLRPEELKEITYPDLYAWWRQVQPAEKKRAIDKMQKQQAYAAVDSDDSANEQDDSGDFSEYTTYAALREREVSLLKTRVQANLHTVSTAGHFTAVLTKLEKASCPQPVVAIVLDAFRPASFERIDTVDEPDMHTAQDFLHSAAVDSCVQIVKNAHWLHEAMSKKLDLVQLLTRYPAGTVLKDKQGQFWRRRHTVAVTRFHFLAPVGDTQEQFYEQKYLLTVPVLPEDSVISAPPKSWMQLCVQKGLCNKEGDALSCLHTAVSKGFKYEDLKALVQLFVDYDYLTATEGDTFMADMPLGTEVQEDEAEVTDTLLTDPASEYGTLLPSTTQNVQGYLDTFTPSQQATFQWLTEKLHSGSKVSAAIVGPAGTGKSYILNAVVAHCRRNGLIVTKLAPSGVAAHLIEGTTIHRFFALDIDLKCSLQHGTVQTTTLRKTDVLVVDEFSMLDATLFRTIEGLCRRYAKKGSSKHPWGGRHVILLGDPAQLPAVSQRDIFGTHLWRTFNVLLLREVVRAKDPQLQTLLEKVRFGIHDEQVESILQSRCQQEDVAKLDLNATVIICSKRAECTKFNELCLDMLDGTGMHYEAIDTDHNGMPLRDADRKRLERDTDRLPDTLHLKVGARVVVRRNIDVERGWVNGTIAQVVSLAQNCIVLCQVDKPKIRLPLPRFKQQITITGASYHIVRRQFPIMPGYAVTVHRVQGMTVKQAVVLLNKSFFASGQAYVALSRVRHLDDLTIWRYHYSAIHILDYYKQLLRWCDAQDAIRPPSLPPVADAQYPSRPDTISNAPLPLDSMDLDNAPEQHSVASSNMTSPLKRNAPSAATSPNSKRSCVPTTTVSSSALAPTAPAQASTVNTAQKRHTTSTNSPTRSKRSCAANIVVPSSPHRLPAAVVLAPGSDQVKPPPDVAWQKQAIATLQRLTPIQFVDKTAAPDAINSARCPEIRPHLLDKALGDGHCGFRALSKAITGTEANHSALRAAIVAFMRSSSADRQRPWIVGTASINAYIQEQKMATRGWMTDRELSFFSTLLQINIAVFSTLDWQTNTRGWFTYKPVFRTADCMARTTDFNLHLRHNRARNHFDRVAFTA